MDAAKNMCLKWMFTVTHNAKWYKGLKWASGQLLNPTALITVQTLETDLISVKGPRWNKFSNLICMIMSVVITINIII